MKRYHLNKKEIMYWANKAFKRLKLKAIPIRIDKVKYPGEGAFFFDFEYMFINVAQVPKKLLCDREAMDVGFLSKSMLIFGILHEVAHYFQYHYHKEWMMKYATDRMYHDFDGLHCDKKLERNADKIAMILFKEFAL